VPPVASLASHSDPVTQGDHGDVSKNWGTPHGGASRLCLRESSSSPEEEGDAPPAWAPFQGEADPGLILSSPHS
jgi:hypothetical protein